MNKDQLPDGADLANDVDRFLKNGGTFPKVAAQAETKRELSYSQKKIIVRFLIESFEGKIPQEDIRIEAKRLKTNFENYRNAGFFEQLPSISLDNLYEVAREGFDRTSRALGATTSPGDHPKIERELEAEFWSKIEQITKAAVEEQGGR